MDTSAMRAKEYDILWPGTFIRVPLAHRHIVERHVAQAKRRGPQTHESVEAAVRHGLEAAQAYLPIDRTKRTPGGLDLTNFEDRAIFRQRVALEYAQTKTTELRRIAGVGRGTRRDDILRSLADDRMGWPPPDGPIDDDLPLQEVAREHARTEFALLRRLAGYNVHTRRDALRAIAKKRKASK